MVPNTMTLGNAPLVTVPHINYVQESSQQQGKGRVGTQHAHPDLSDPQICVVNENTLESSLQISNI